MNVTPEIREKLRAPFPGEAIKQHDNKPYLSTIKAIYIVERLNDIFGIGGWEIETTIIEDTVDYVSMSGQIWLKEPYNFKTPVQYGGHKKTGTGTEPADGYKSAVTDCQSKCASYLEIGIDVFKGLVTPEGKKTEKNQNHGMACPKCGADAIIIGKPEYGGGWVCFAKKGGCGAKFETDPSKIQKAPPGKSENLLVAKQGTAIIKIGSEKHGLSMEETKKVIDWYCGTNGRTYASGEYLKKNFDSALDDYLKVTLQNSIKNEREPGQDG